MSAGTVEEIAGLVAQRYAEVRVETATTQLLTSRGLTFQQYYQMHQQLLPQIVGGIDQAMTGFDLGVEMIIAGVDGSGAHIFTVGNPGGMAQRHDVIGAVAIGSGQIHAIQSMIGFRHGSMDPLKDVLFRVFSSKRRAELAPGVGHETDLAVISARGVRHLSGRTLEALDSIDATVQSTSGACLSEEVGKLSLEFADESSDNGAAGTSASGAGDHA